MLPFSSYLTLNNRELAKGHWTLFKLVPFESLGSVSYLPSIVTVAVSLTISALKNSVTLKTGLWVVQDHWKWRRSIDHIRLSVGSPL